jgi:prepilin-type N-terminal cleavage/methylation domain-containing protein
MTRLRTTSDTRARRRDRRFRSRSGFGLIEVIIALVVMAIGMLGLAGMLLQVARRATELSGQNGRAAVSTQVLNRLAALPYDQLGNAVGCTSVSNAQFSHTQCVSVIDAGGYKSIRLVVTPANARVRADTTYLIRSP